MEGNLKIFKINEYITLKYENDHTNIYVKDRFFNQCKYLLINIADSERYMYDDIESIDAAAEMLDHSQERRSKDFISKIPSEVEFWGHCSNIQAWVENSYDTRLLHKNLAFPLLKRLTDEGDPDARKVFKEEIALRFVSGHQTVVGYLIAQGYLKYLNPEEMINIIESITNKLDLAKICYNLLKNENDLYAVSLKDKLSTLKASVLKGIIYLLLKLIFKEKKHVWGMEKQGGDFHSIQMKILIKMKDEYMDVLHRSDKNPNWHLELMQFFEKIYKLTYEVIQKLSRSSSSINYKNLDEEFNLVFKSLNQEF